MGRMGKVRVRRCTGCRWGEAPGKEGIAGLAEQKVHFGLGPSTGCSDLRCDGICADC